MISIQKLLRLGVVALCVLGVAAQVQAEDFRHWIVDSKSPPNVGVQVKIERFTPAMATRIKNAGFNFVRFGVWVNAMQATEYQKRVSSAFATAQNAGLPVLLTVRSTISLAPSSSDSAAYNAKLRAAAARLVRVVSNLVGAYGTNLLAIELWNEPELPTYWPTGSVDTTFPIYMQAVCSGLKSVHASTVVVGFGFAAAPKSGSQSDRLLQSLGSSSDGCIDAVSYHAYGMNASQIRQASRYIFSRYGLPALITEWGVSSGSKGGIYGQSADIQSFLMKRSSLSTSLISIYEWQDTLNGKNARERNFGLVTASGARKPALDTASTVLRR
jgi:hypothetical protein